MERLTYVVTVETDGPVGQERLPDTYAPGVCAKALFDAAGKMEGVGQLSVLLVNGGIKPMHHRGDVCEPLADLLQAAASVVRDWEGRIADHVNAMRESLEALGYTPRQLQAKGR